MLTTLDRRILMWNINRNEQSDRDRKFLLAFITIIDTLFVGPSDHPYLVFVGSHRPCQHKKKNRTARHMPLKSGWTVFSFFNSIGIGVCITHVTPHQ